MRWRFGAKLLAGALLTIVGAAGCGGSPAKPDAAATAGGAKAELKKVKIVAGGNTLGCFGPAFLAQNEGFFKNQGLDVEIIQVDGGVLAVAALAGGDVPVALSGGTQLVQTMMQGKDLKIVAGLIDGMNAKIVLSKKAAAAKNLTATSPLEDKIKALKGLKIASTKPGDTAWNLVVMLLKKYGLDPEKDIEMISQGVGGPMIAALQQGTIDGFSISSPFPEQAEQNGTGIVLVSPPRGDVPDLAGMYYCAVATRPDVMQKDPDLLVRVVKGLVQAGDLLANDKAKAKASLRAWFKDLDDKTFEATFEANYPVLAKDPEPTEQNINALVKFWAAATGGDPSKATFARIAEPKFAKQAKQELKK